MDELASRFAAGYGTLLNEGDSSLIGGDGGVWMQEPHDERIAQRMNNAHHVLVVEDSPPLSDAFRIMLERSGFRVSVANSLAAALQVAEIADVLLIDIGLPDGDGIGLIESLSGLGRPPQFSIALTGHDDPKTRERCINAGCADVIVKPIAVTALVQRVKSLLAKGSSPAAGTGAVS